MPDDSGGNNSLPPGYLAVTGQTVLASQHNPPLEDLSASMSRRYMRDGRAPMLGDVPMNGYRAKAAANAIDPQDYVTLSQVQALIAAVAGVPTGALMPLTGSVVPTAWVVADGQTLSRATYPNFWTWVQASGNLAATEGAKTVGQYGPGDGSTTFSVPNLYADNGYFIRPISSGRLIGSVQADELKSHVHVATFVGNAVPDHQHGVGASFVGSGTGSDGGYILASGNNAITTPAGGHVPSGTVSVNSTGGTETRPKNIAFPVIIKT